MTKIYTIEGCKYCTELKARLDDMGIKYVEVDVNKPENEDDFNRIYEITKCDMLPIALVDKAILVGETSFKTIEEASLIIQELNK